MANSDLCFLHISDLHFRAGPGRSETLHDQDKALREAALADVRRFVAESERGMDGILVSGDVAYCGSKADYEIAIPWLAELSGAASCGAEAVWVVPGNHDVDRSVIADSPMLRAFRNEVRTVNPLNRIDDKLREWLTSSESSLIFGPLASYNDFAAKFRCRVSAEKPFWEKDFTLNDGSVLRLRGITSVLACDGQESEDGLRLVVGAMQWSGMTTIGVTNLVLCHHPPVWLRDADAFDDASANLAAIQLFGHKHRQRVRTIDNTVRLYAGALHPDRGEVGWEPRFNYLSFGVDAPKNSRQLLATIEARIWSAEASRFVVGAVGNAAEPGPRLYRVPLSAWRPSSPSSAPRENLRGGEASGPKPPLNVVASSNNEVVAMRTGDSTSSGIADPVRRLIYRYLTLPHRQRAEIAQTLALVRDEDDGVRDSELVDLYFTRANSEGRLADLWLEVERLHGVDDASRGNPFKPIER